MAGKFRDTHRFCP
jgi:D-alanyl-D-alanine dipeptidase